MGHDPPSGGRLLDGIEPELVHRAGHALEDPGILGVEKLQMRWIGNQIHGRAVVSVAFGSTVQEADGLRREAQRRLGHALADVEEITVAVARACQFLGSGALSVVGGVL